MEKEQTKEMRVILPKGTLLHYQGFPCELAQDTEVYSATIRQMGLAAIEALHNQCSDNNDNAC